MKLLALLCTLLLCAASFTAYFYIDHKINIGQKLLQAGQKQYNEGQKKLATGKTKLAAGKKKLSTAKKTYNSTLGLLPIRTVTKIIPVVGPTINQTTDEIDVAHKMIQDGDRQVAEGERKVRMGEAQLAAGKKQLADGRIQLERAKQLRFMFLFGGIGFSVLSLFLAVSLLSRYKKWR